MTSILKHRRLLKAINWLLLFSFAITALAVGLALKDDWVKPKSDYTKSLNVGWTRINPDGTEEPVSGQFSIGTTDPVTFYRRLPYDISEENILRIKCPYTNVTATIDGQQVYHAGPATLGHITTTIGNVFALIPLKSDDAGKLIYITVEPRHYRYEVLIKDAAITTMSTYALARIEECVPYFILCIVQLIISLVSFVLFAVFKLSGDHHRKNDANAFLHLAVFGICAIGWILSDYHIGGMLSGNMVFSGMINYVCFMLCPVLFSGILLYVFEKKLFFKGLFIISECNFLIQMTLFFAGIIDLSDGLPYSQFLTVFLVFAMVYFSLMNIRHFAKTNLLLLGLPTICFFIFAVAAAVSYLINGEWMLYVALALTFYAFTVIAYLLINLWHALMKNIKLEDIERIAYLDNLTQMENRRAYDEYVTFLNKRFRDGDGDDKLLAIIIDINGLKKTNDIYGHPAGDELITGSAASIKKAFSAYGRCFRIGGDEFAVIASMDNETYVQHVKMMEDDLAAFRGDYVEGISVSVGKAARAEYPTHLAHQLLNTADKHMYENKQHYYASLLTIEDDGAAETDSKSSRRIRYSDKFVLSKYTMPIIRQMAEVIPGGFFIYREDETRELLYHNRRVLDIYGCKDSGEFRELTGYTFEGMVYHEDFVTIQNSIDTQIDSEDGDGMDHVIYRITRKDGQIRWVDDYGHFSHSEDYGDIYYVFISDITDQMEAKHIHNAVDANHLN
ncbi:MAG: diguanylate cyclase [Lachnospiraceae bacterium]|nr:diguanylate cyclase [Lachnospiraceae bacterium]